MSRTTLEDLGPLPSVESMTCTTEGCHRPRRWYGLCEQHALDSEREACAALCDAVATEAQRCAQLIRARKGASFPYPAPAAPVCKTCNDTHKMQLDDREVNCTGCPVPCAKCRAGGVGAYCEKTPCACACHARRTP